MLSPSTAEEAADAGVSVSPAAAGIGDGTIGIEVEVPASRFSYHHTPPAIAPRTRTAMIMLSAAEPRTQRMFVFEGFMGQTLRECRTKCANLQLARPNSGIDGNPNRIRKAVLDNKPAIAAACIRPTLGSTCPEVSCASRPDKTDRSACTPLSSASINVRTKER